MVTSALHFNQIDRDKMELKGLGGRRCHVLVFPIKELVRFFMLAVADLNSLDANGRRPFDVIGVLPKLLNIRSELEELPATNSPTLIGDCNLRVSTSSFGSPSLSSSPEDGSPSSSSDSTLSPMMAKFHDLPANLGSEQKEYPMDPSLLDIRRLKKKKKIDVCCWFG